MRIHVDGYVNGVCPCLRNVKGDIIHVDVISREQVHIDGMSRVCHGRRSCFVKNKSCLGCLRTPEKKFKMFPS